MTERQAGRKKTGMPDSQTKRHDRQTSKPGRQTNRQTGGKRQA